MYYLNCTYAASSATCDPSHWRLGWLTRLQREIDCVTHGRGFQAQWCQISGTITTSDLHAHRDVYGWEGECEVGSLWRFFALGIGSFSRHAALVSLISTRGWACAKNISTHNEPATVGGKSHPARKPCPQVGDSPTNKSPQLCVFLLF